MRVKSWSQALLADPEDTGQTHILLSHKDQDSHRPRLIVLLPAAEASTTTVSLRSPTPAHANRALAAIHLQGRQNNNIYCLVTVSDCFDAASPLSVVRTDGCN